MVGDISTATIHDGHYQFVMTLVVFDSGDTAMLMVMRKLMVDDFLCY